MLKVVRAAFKETAAVRFEGNNYSDEWVVEAAEARPAQPAPHAGSAGAAQRPKAPKALFKATGILTEAELESRYHVRMERYVKDILIELHTLQQMVDTQILPAAYAYVGQLAQAAGQGAAAGINMQPLVDAANATTKLVATLQKKRAELAKVIAKAEGMHDDLVRAGHVSHQHRLRDDGRCARGGRRARADGRRRVLAAAAVPGDAVPGLTTNGRPRDSQNPVLNQSREPRLGSRL